MFWRWGRSGRWGEGLRSIEYCCVLYIVVRGVFLKYDFN